MNTKVVHYLVGYDQFTGRTIWQCGIQENCLAQAIQIVQPDDDPEAMGSYELTGEQAKRIAKLLHIELVGNIHLDFFFKSFDEPERRSRAG
jgi:hypothetical protein